jgi:hypothetical protein
VWLAQEEQFTLRVEAEEEVISVYLFLAILLRKASGFVTPKNFWVASEKKNTHAVLHGFQNLYNILNSPLWFLLVFYYRFDSMLNTP